MITHIVCWKLKKEAEGRSLEENAAILIRELESLKDRIPSIRIIEAGRNFNPSASAFDVGLYSVFDDEKGLEEYQSHPEHKKVADFVSKIAEARVVTDWKK